MEHKNLLGAALMVASMTAFTVNDVFIKLLADEVPLFQSIFLRGIGSTIIVFIIARAMGQWPSNLSWREWRIILIRSVAEVGSAYFFLTAVVNMPISNAIAIMQMLPLTVALGGALFMGESIGRNRISAMMIGFAAVLLIIQPGTDGFTVYSIYALGAVASVTVRDLIVRKLDDNTPSIFVGGVASGAVCLVFGVATLSEPWAEITVLSGAYLTGATVAIVFGYIFAVTAMRVGEIGFVTPFRYSSAVVALIMGAAVFSERPNALMLTGLLIVVLTGMYTIFRERRAAAMSAQILREGR